MKTPSILFTLILTALWGAVAKSNPWSNPIRGTWLRQGALQPGDITMVSPQAKARGRAVQIVIAPNEPPPVQQAARFLSGDIARLSGYSYKPPIVAKAAPGRPAIHLVTRGNSSLPPNAGAAKLDGLWEAHRVVTLGSDVWLIGSNFRGTTFAAYTLSERLGIDPLYLWTGYEPVPHATLILKKTDYYAPPPTFRFRGLFHDDEDILPRPVVDGLPDRNGTVPLEWYARFFETALRLRMNMTAPFVRVQRPFAVQKLASDWGLFYTSHHYDVLLSNPYGYDRFGLAKTRGVQGRYDWLQNREGLLAYWKAGVMENRNLHCIWPVGLRGTEDYGMPFPGGTTEAQKAQVYSDAIAAQVRMVKELLPKGKTPLFHFTMYTEVLDIYRQGQLIVPNDVTLVWPDNNDGVMRALPEQRGKHKHGIYYHLAYLGPGVTKQTFHTVQPSRVEEEFRKIIAAGATDYLLINVSEVRPFVMESRMLADIAWDAPGAFRTPDAAGRFVRWWSREYFGPKAVPLATKAYEDYYRLISASGDLYIGTGKVWGAINSLKLKFAGEPFHPARPETMPDLERRGASYRAALRDCELAAAQMNLEQQQFFFENVTLGLLSDYRSVQAAILLVMAMSAPNRQQSLGLCRLAKLPLEQLERELARGERRPFKGWYGPTWILKPDSGFNPHRSYLALQSLLKEVE